MKTKNLTKKPGRILTVGIIVIVLIGLALVVFPNIGPQLALLPNPFSNTPTPTQPAVPTLTATPAITAIPTLSVALLSLYTPNIALQEPFVAPTPLTITIPQYRTTINVPRVNLPYTPLYNPPTFNPITPMQFPRAYSPSVLPLDYYYNPIYQFKNPIYNPPTIYNPATLYNPPTIYNPPALYNPPTIYNPPSLFIPPPIYNPPIIHIPN